MKEFEEIQTRQDFERFIEPVGKQDGGFQVTSQEVPMEEAQNNMEEVLVPVGTKGMSKKDTAMWFNVSERHIGNWIQDIEDLFPALAGKVYHRKIVTLLGLGLMARLQRSCGKAYPIRNTDGSIKEMKPNDTPISKADWAVDVIEWLTQNCPELFQSSQQSKQQLPQPEPQSEPQPEVTVEPPGASPLALFKPEVLALYNQSQQPDNSLPVSSETKLYFTPTDYSNRYQSTEMMVANQSGKEVNFANELLAKFAEMAADNQAWNQAENQKQDVQQRDATLRGMNRALNEFLNENTAYRGLKHQLETGQITPEQVLTMLMQFQGKGQSPDGSSVAS